MKSNCKHLMLVFTLTIMIPIGGCASLRLHNPGSLESSKESVKLAKEIGSGTSAVFDPMEENLNTAKEAQDKARKISQDIIFEISLGGFANKTALKLGEKYKKDVKKYFDIKKETDQILNNSAHAVNKQLDRQKNLKDAFKDESKDCKDGETENCKKSLTSTLNRVKKRLATTEKALKAILSSDKFKTIVSKNSAIVDAAAQSGKVLSILQNGLKKGEEALNQANNDERVKSAKKLLKQMGLVVLGMEQTRLLELQRYLNEVKFIKSRIDKRNILVCQRHSQIWGPLYGALQGQTTSNDKVSALIQYFEEETIEVKKGDKKTPVDQYWNHMASCKIYNPKPTDFNKTGPSAKALWQDKKLIEYIDAQIEVEKFSSVQMAVALAEFRFHDVPLIKDLRLEFHREAHRHSIRLSKINAQQRADLVHILAQGLQNFHEGGFKPEQIAELILLVAQTGALSGIAAK